MEWKALHGISWQKTFSYLSIAVLALIFVSFLFLYGRAILFFAILLSANFALGLFLRPIKFLSPGLEFIMLGGVLGGMYLGFLPGAVIATLSFLSMYVAMARTSIRVFVSLPLYILMVLFASFFSGSNPFVVGITLTIIFNLIAYPIFFLCGSSLVRISIFSISNIIFNYLFFLHLTPIVLILLP